MAQIEGDKLNDLLEDALNDLLLEDELQAREPEIVSQATVENVEDYLIRRDLLVAKKSQIGKVETASTSSSSKNIEPPGFDENEMNKFFEDMTAKLKSELPKIDPEEARAKINESVPQIFDLMQNLLSKELLYPALKDLSPKFDEWLKKNAPTLSKADKRRYRKQKEIIDEIIYVFDDESIDSQERFEKNLDLMEKMQSLGSPPEELTVPEGVGRCSVM